MRHSLFLEEEVALLLTATIAVNPGVPGVSASDPKEREESYAVTLRYFLRHHPRLRRLVFAENSGWPLNRLEEVTRTNPLSKEVELVSLQANDFPGSFGKGYGEALLIDRALAVSEILHRVGYVAKLTGRQRLLNATTLLERVPAPVHFLCDLKDHGIYEVLRLPAAGRYCDTRFFAFQISFFDRFFRHLHHDHHQGELNLEAQYYERVKALEGTPGVVCRFPVEPEYRGRAGHWDKNYGSPGEQVKRHLRRVLRRLWPSLRV